MTIKSYIIEYLRTRKNLGIEWTAGGTIETYLKTIKPLKGETISRPLRRMSEKDDPNRILDKIKDKGYVEYKLRII